VTDGQSVTKAEAYSSAISLTGFPPDHPQTQPHRLEKHFKYHTRMNLSQAEVNTNYTLTRPRRRWQPIIKWKCRHSPARWPNPNRRRMPNHRLASMDTHWYVYVGSKCCRSGSGTALLQFPRHLKSQPQYSRMCTSVLLRQSHATTTARYCYPTDATTTRKVQQARFTLPSLSNKHSTINVYSSGSQRNFLVARHCFLRASEGLQFPELMQLELSVTDFFPNRVGIRLSRI
jgi:hypothetical protein